MALCMVGDAHATILSSKQAGLFHGDENEEKLSLETPGKPHSGAETVGYTIASHDNNP